MKPRLTKWSGARRNLRAFAAKSGWTPAQIAKALREGYGASGTATAGFVAALLDVDAGPPWDGSGYLPVVQLCNAHARSQSLPSFEDWLARRRARVPASFWRVGDALTARAVAVEEARAERVRELLAQERVRGRPPIHDFAGLDAATVAALSGGTIQRRGPQGVAA